MKGVHTLAFNKIASAILLKESEGGIISKEKIIAYAIAMKKLGRDKAVNKSHWRKTKKRGK